MRKGEMTKQAILDQAARVASRVGLAGLTIGTLAEQTKLSKSGLFAHFKSKESLQQEVLQHATARFIELVMRPAIMSPRGEPRMRELFERWVGWCCGDELPGGCLFFAAAAELDDQPGPARDQLVRDQRDLIDSIIQIFRGAVGEGHFRGDADPEQFAQDLQSILLGFSYTHRLLKDPAAKDRTRRSFESLLSNVRKNKH